MAAIHGVIVQSMVPSGVEIVVGARVDPSLGPLIVVGFGGILVELLKDSAVELAPINRDEALRMLTKLKGSTCSPAFAAARRSIPRAPRRHHRAAFRIRGGPARRRC